MVVEGERRKGVSEKEPGATEKAKGLAKEVVGVVTRDEEMKAEGRAERGKGSAGGHKEYFEKVIEESGKRSGL